MRAGFRVGVLAMAVLLVGACSSKGSSQGGPTIDSLKKGGREYSLVQAQSQLTVGTSRLAFGLVSRAGDQLAGAATQVWLASDEHSRALGPFTAQWLVWSAPHDDKTGTPPVPGFYRVELSAPRAGNWIVLAKAMDKGKPVVGVAALEATDRPVAGIGTKALSEPTPVATTPEAAAKIDTRDPPSPLHYISLDEALRSGRPTVVVFATPLLCESRMCGPVVDEVLGVYDRVGRDKANFIHVEIYPQRDAQKPAPEFLRFGFQSEPWTLVIDKDGVIRGRFEGPVVGTEVEDALRPLLTT